MAGARLDQEVTYDTCMASIESTYRSTETLINSVDYKYYAEKTGIEQSMSRVILKNKYREAQNSVQKASRLALVPLTPQTIAAELRKLQVENVLIKFANEQKKIVAEGLATSIKDRAEVATAHITRLKQIETSLHDEKAAGELEKTRAEKLTLLCQISERSGLTALNNYRLELQALEKLKELIQERATVAESYLKKLRDIECTPTPKASSKQTLEGFYAKITCKEDLAILDKYIDSLKDRIQLVIFYAPMLREEHSKEGLRLIDEAIRQGMNFEVGELTRKIIKEKLDDDVKSQSAQKIFQYVTNTLPGWLKSQCIQDKVDVVFRKITEFKLGYFDSTVSRTLLSNYHRQQISSADSILLHLEKMELFLQTKTLAAGHSQKGRYLRFDTQDKLDSINLETSSTQDIQSVLVLIQQEIAQADQLEQEEKRETEKFKTQLEQWNEELDDVIADFKEYNEKHPAISRIRFGLGAISNSYDWITIGYKKNRAHITNFYLGMLHQAKRDLLEELTKHTGESTHPLIQNSKNFLTNLNLKDAILNDDDNEVLDHYIAVIKNIIQYEKEKLEKQRADAIKNAKRKDQEFQFNYQLNNEFEYLIETARSVIDELAKLQSTDDTMQQALHKSLTMSLNNMVGIPLPNEKIPDTHLTYDVLGQVEDHVEQMKLHIKQLKSDREEKAREEKEARAKKLLRIPRHLHVSEQIIKEESENKKEKENDKVKVTLIQIDKTCDNKVSALLAQKTVEERMKSRGYSAISGIYNMGIFKSEMMGCEDSLNFDAQDRSMGYKQR